MSDSARISRKSAKEPATAAELIAVIVAVSGDMPRVLTIEDAAALPSGPFESAHRSLQSALRQWVEQQTHHRLGYVEQLYTFADSDRTMEGAERRVISVSSFCPAPGGRSPGGHARRGRG